MSLDLQSDIRYLKGVGQRRAALFAKLGIMTCHDLITYSPRSYIDLTKTVPIADLPLDTLCAVRCRVSYCGKEQRIRKGLSIFKVLAADSSGEIEFTFFNNKYLVASLKTDEEYIFYGKVEGTLFRKVVSSPQVFPISSQGYFIPVYPLTAGLTSKFISSCVKTVLQEVAEFEESLPHEIRIKHNLCTRDYAIRNLHFPSDSKGLETARSRLIFEEFFVLSLAMSMLKSSRVMEKTEPMEHFEFKSFYSKLPFKPTDAQIRCINEAAGDLCRPTPMNRLIQGDVGSGKTLVAAACIWLCAKNSGQAAMMAPTEILAEQHFSTLESLLDGSGIRIGLLTGSLTAAQKRKVKEGLKNGEIDLIVGTHAIITPDVDFYNLRLVITDEQHRFGVAQRLALSQKGENVHTLVMSATPIPRTLSLIIYGELDISVIDQLPPGRSPVETYRISSDKRMRALNFIKKHIESGKQAYIVCPLIQQGEEETDLASAEEYAQELAAGILKDCSISLIHGKLSSKEKEKVMHSFKNGDVQVLVSTTVIEVGVDIPNAVIMMIENAERFGLSQLHQLRGRVGRGRDKSYCILLSDSKSQETIARLNIMCSTTDGFKIAEEDLKIRGPGDFFGYRQHGLPELRLANFAANMSELSVAQAACEDFIHDYDIKQLPLLNCQVNRLLEAVGERPN